MSEYRINFDYNLNPWKSNSKKAESLINTAFSAKILAFEFASNWCRKSGVLEYSKYLISCWFQGLLNNRGFTNSGKILKSLTPFYTTLKCINIACQFVKDKNRTVVQKYPCQLQVLTLTARKTHTVLTPPSSLRFAAGGVPSLQTRQTSPSTTCFASAIWTTKPLPALMLCTVLCVSSQFRATISRLTIVPRLSSSLWQCRPYWR